MTLPLSSPRFSGWRLIRWILGLLAGLALALALYYYFTGDDYTLRVQEVAQLKPVPTVLQHVRIGLDELPVRVNGYLVSATHDVTGPFVRPDAAVALLGLLAVALVFYLAVISTLPRLSFVAGMALLFFLLMSFNADMLGVFDSREQYFLILSLLTLGVPAYVFHAFWTDVPQGRRLLTFALLVAGLAALLFQRSDNPADTTALHLVSYATSSGAAAVALLVLWLSFENIYGLLWFNSQAENPGSRFGILPFLLASGLYLGTLLLYYWNNGELLILPGVSLDPLVLLLPAAVISWLNLRRRAATYGEFVPFAAAQLLFLVLLTVAAGFLGFAFATANDPLLSAARDFTALALLCVGTAFLIYVLFNFVTLIRQKLRVFRVVYEPRRLPFYIVYVVGIGSLLAVEMRNNFFVLDQVQAGYFNNVGDLTRLQSEEQPNADGLALLAERYYAESDVLDQHNHRASMGRAALYHFRSQRQNEINALRRALSRAPSEKISLRLAALYNEPGDFFDRLAVLRQGIKNTPRSARLANDLAQLYTRSTLTDSVDYYLQRAEALAPNSSAVETNRLAFLLQNQQVAAARQLIAERKGGADNAAWDSNVSLLYLLTGKPQKPAPVELPSPVLTTAGFARLYHDALHRAALADTSQLPLLARLAQQPDNSAYADQLTFLRALTQHYGGQTVAAQNTLLPLTTGNSAGSAYYQNLWGLWLLEQQQYRPAAARLADAHRNGYAEAALFRAYALALLNQPDSARFSAQQALPDKTFGTSRRAQRLLSVLNLDFNTQYPAAPDSVKAQYLVLRGGSLYPESLVPRAAGLSTAASREAALLAQIPRALLAGQLPAAQQALELFAPKPATATPTGSAWNVLRGQLYLQSKQLPQLRTVVQQGYFSRLDRPYQLYYRAALAQAENQAPAAAKFYAQVVREAPYLEQAVLAAADFYLSRQQDMPAYNALLKGLEYNPESVPLLKAYTLAAIPAGLGEYAAASLEKLRPLLSPAEYSTFLSQYNARRATQTAAATPWN
ncbi:tetratricopeptide repeat protein [Hymenobacter chitinivorans]|uniref:Tetratricopeptide repeat protein n=1 Tax=Hymenobacter chitinivorans DSM 11115 TaxID=1121954 RepID=A0A2M9AQF2_9BACT|nr:hypothetical protein [Hymenobacter chitinivorans]PJJ47931.1 hypothetical protein CLV45_4622 [Hymenobacter chitinivorans DSM 11115]